MTESALTSNEVKSPQPSNNAKPATLQPQAAPQVEPGQQPPVINPETSINSPPNPSTSTQYVASSNKLFVGGLAHLNHTNEMLEEYFSKWGKVLSFQIIKVSLESKIDEIGYDQIKDASHRSKGYGFVTFAHVDSASACLNNAQHFIEGRSVSVKVQI